MTIADIRQNHVDRAGADFDEALYRIKNLILTYNGSEIARLIRRLLTLDSHTRFSVFGMTENLNGYPEMAGAGSAVSILRSVAQFVSYDLCDDGEPSVAYCRYHEDEGVYVEAIPFHPNAKPYFHRNLNQLQKKFPASKLLDAERAHEVLDWYQNKRETRIKEIQDDIRSGEGFYEPEDLAAYRITELELDMQILLDEFSVGFYASP